MVTALTVPVWGLILQWLSDSEQHFSLWVADGKECLVCKELSDKHKAGMAFVKPRSPKHSHIDCIYLDKSNHTQTVYIQTRAITHTLHTFRQESVTQSSLHYLVQFTEHPSYSILTNQNSFWSSTDRQCILTFLFSQTPELYPKL